MSSAIGNHLTEWDNIMETAISVWHTEGAETITYLQVQEALSSATTLFGSEVLDVLERMKDTENVSVGVLPYPLYSESQENYAHYVDNHFYAYLVPTSVSNPTVMGEFLEVYAFHSRYLVRPAWIDAYSYDYCSDADSAEMLQIILDTRTYDPAYVWWSQYESSISGFIENSQNESTSPHIIGIRNARAKQIKAGSANSGKYFLSVFSISTSFINKAVKSSDMTASVQAETITFLSAQLREPMRPLQSALPDPMYSFH